MKKYLKTLSATMVAAAIAVSLVGCTSVNKQATSEKEVISRPPMGWITWTCFGASVTEEEIKTNADFMAENLKEAGYEYIINDIGWYAPNMVTLEHFRSNNPEQLIDEYGRFIPDPVKYPSAKEGKGLKPLADYIHSKGLKFGIHIMRGIPIQAIEKNTPIKGTKYFARDIVLKDSKCEWYHGLYGIDMSKPGAQEYYNSIIELYESWGIDYIKADDLMDPIYRHDEIHGIGNAIKKANRPMVLSLSPGPAPIDNVKDIKDISHMWRISSDFWDYWKSLKNQFDLAHKWTGYSEKGQYADLDMMPIGPIGQRAVDIPTPRISNFTKDEQHTMFTLWCMFQSPILLGCNLVEMDDELVTLVTNKELLKVNKNSKNNHQFYSENGIIGWFATVDDESSDYVAIFNLNDDPLENFTMDLGILNRNKYQKGTELWKNENIIIKDNKLDNLTIAPHGVAVYKLQ